MSTLELSHDRLALHRRFERAARSLAYLGLGLALGVLDLVAVPVVLLGDTGATLRRLLELERTSTNRLLGARIPALPPTVPGSSPERRKIAFLAAKLPLTALATVVCLIPGALVLVLVVRASEGFAGSTSYLGPWSLGPIVGLVLLLLASAALVLCAAALIRSGSLLARFSRGALASRADVGVPVREALAERLGDRTLAIAYWLPERELFVDEHGHPVALPEPNSDRSWVAVEHGGRRVAAIIHDAELEARPELVEAAAAGAVLAFENERLKADLRARLEELRASRKRIVEASLETRKQFERDLHDGAQQRLVSLSIDLEVLRGKLEDEASREFVDTARAKLAEALAELREFARGIHPALLTDRGLAPALEALALRSPVPVELELQLTQRPASSVEAAVYFVVAEALTNVARYAKATHAVVSVTDTTEALIVEVRDDGVGGAEASRGSGLRGLGDRVAALDGRLSVESPPGGGTRVGATIPRKHHAGGEPAR